MSKWYKSALVKGILIFLSVLSAITALLSLVIISTYSVSVKEIWNKKPTEYTDSKEFENQMCRATMDVLGQISCHCRRVRLYLGHIHSGRHLL